MARKNMTTSIENNLQKEIKKLAIDLERPLNDLIEEAFHDLLKKYDKKPKNQRCQKNIQNALYTITLTAEKLITGKSVQLSVKTKNASKSCIKIAKKEDK